MFLAFKTYAIFTAVVNLPYVKLLNHLRTKIFMTKKSSILCILDLTLWSLQSIFIVHVSLFGCIMLKNMNIYRWPFELRIFAINFSTCTVLYIRLLSQITIMVIPVLESSCLWALLYIFCDLMLLHDFI